MNKFKISKLKELSKKVALGGLTLFYSERAHQHKKNSLKYRRESQEYKNQLEEIVGYKNGFSIKNELKRFGTKIALNYLISSSNAKANKQWEKSLKYRKTAQGYSNRFEEIMGYKNRLEETTTRKESNSPNIETAVNKDYHTPMKESYQKYEAKNDTLTSTIGKILSGDYIENGQRIWYWKDRVKKVEEYAKNVSFSEETQKEIFAILKNNNYFMKKKTEELSQLNNILFRGIKKEIEDYLHGVTKTFDNYSKEIPKTNYENSSKTIKESESKKNIKYNLEKTVNLNKGNIKTYEKVATLPTEGNLIAVGRINGILDKFKKVIKKFEDEYKQNDKTYLLLLGGYLEFGKDRITIESTKILDQLIELKEKYGEHIIPLIGADEILHYRTNASHYQEDIWQDYGIKKDQIEKHIHLLESQPIAAVMNGRFLFTASGPLKWVKSLEDLANVQYLGDLPEDMLKSLSSGRDLFTSYSEYVTAGKEMINSLGLKSAIYGDGRIALQNKAENSEGFQMKFKTSSYLKLDLSKDYKSTFDLRRGKEILELS